MIQVSNKKAIRNLSRKSIKANWLRNCIAILAIALTATLFTALFTVGGSLLASFQEGTMRQVGTRSHGGFKFLTQEQYDTLCEDPKIKDISYNIIIGIAENPELNKTYTEIRWTEEKAAEWSFCTPTTGCLPKSGMELATTTAVLDALGIPHELGTSVPLTFTANGIQYHDTFTLCGFWENDVMLGASQAFVSREYCDRVAPVLTVPLYEQDTTDELSYAGSINPSLWFATSWNIEGQMEALEERCGFDMSKVNDGVNWAYASDTVDFQSVLLVIAFLLLVGLSGYLIIYNVFYISVSRDIRYYGLLKTIGTTGKQLKRIVHQQAFLLCLIGIPLGLLCGWACGRLLLPAIITTSTLDSSNMVISANPFIFIGAALFALLTVWISCIRPCHLAAKVSPIEAIRYVGTTQKKTKALEKQSKTVTPFSMAMANLRRDSKKAVAVVLSLSLSMILLNATYTIVSGFDMERYLQNKVVTDFLISDASVRNVFSAGQVIDGVMPTVLEEISNLEGLTGMGSVYMREANHVLSETAYQRALDIVEKNRDDVYFENSVAILKEEHGMAAHIYGVDPYLFDKLELTEYGKFDKEKFLSGDYVLATAFWNTGRDAYYVPGDTVTLDFGNGNSKEYTVLAIGDIPYALGPQHSHGLDIYFTLPTSEYQKQIGETQPLCTGFDVDDTHTEAVEDWITTYCDAVEPNLSYESRALYVREFENEQTMFTLVGGVLSFVLGLIGILNFINTTITSILTRRRELAMLQSVGMTGKQVRQMLIGEGGFYAVLTLLFTLTLGNLLSYLGVQAIAHEIWFFTYHFTLTPVLICVPILILVAVLVPWISYRLLTKQSIVERLRETE